MAAIDTVLRQFAQAGASDLHLQSDQGPKLRCGAAMAEGSIGEALDTAALMAMLKEIAPPNDWREFERSGACLLVYALDEQRYRIATTLYSGGLSLVCRRIPAALATIDELGLAPILKEMVRQRAGLIVIAGAARSGRSTTAAALLQEINQTPRRVLVLEHPVEFVIPAGAAAIVHREVHCHCSSVAHALDAAIHEGFDVVHAGELDLERRVDIEAVLEAAEAGVLVIVTLRASSATRAIERIVGALPPSQHAWVRMMLCNCLRGVSVQVLPALANGTGRCACQEMLVGTTGICAAIRDGNISKLGTMIQAGGADGMLTLDDALMRKVQAKLITPAEAQVHANDKQRFAAMIEQPPEPEPAPPPVAPPLPTAAKGPSPPPRRGVFT